MTRIAKAELLAALRREAYGELPSVDGLRGRGKRIAGVPRPQMDPLAACVLANAEYRKSRLHRPKRKLKKKA